MRREKLFEEIAEEMGFADELPDTPDAYVRNIDKVEIDEIEFGDISNNIERRMEGFMRRLGLKYEECESINDMLEDEILFSISDWEYDRDATISSVAKKTRKDNKEIWNKVVDIVIDRDLETNIDVARILNEEIESINSEFGCGVPPVEEPQTEFSISGTGIFYLASDAFDMIRNDSVCSGISLEKIRDVSPVIYATRKSDLNDAKAYNKIKSQLITTKRAEKCKNLPKVEVSDFAIVTRNEDVSFACNPWSQEYFSDELKERIAAAKERVTIAF